MMSLAIKPAQLYVKEAALPEQPFGAAVPGAVTTDVRPNVTPNVPVLQAIDEFRAVLKNLRTNLNPQIKAVNTLIKTYEKPLVELYEQIQSGQVPSNLDVDGIVNGLGQANQLAGRLLQGEQMDANGLAQVEEILQNVQQILNVGMQGSIEQGMAQEAANPATGQSISNEEALAAASGGTASQVQQPRVDGKFGPNPTYNAPGNGAGAGYTPPGPGTSAPGRWGRGLWNKLNQPLTWGRAAESNELILTAGSGSATY